MGEISACVSLWPFFKFLNVTMEVVTFCLLGWCKGFLLLLLLAFTYLGHECGDLLSLCDGIHGCTDWTLVYTLIQRSFREWSHTLRKFPSTRQL